MATNRRMERSTKEMHKFLAEHTTEDMTMDEINALLQEHLGEINAGIDRRRTEETAETADDYMDMAEDRLAEGNEQEALRLARKALKLEPDNLDADHGGLSPMAPGPWGTVPRGTARGGYGGKR